MILGKRSRPDMVAALGCLATLEGLLSAEYQGGGGLPREGGLARCGHVIEHIAFLKAKCRNDRQNALDEAAPVRAIGSETTFAPQNAWTQDTLARVVRRLDSLHEHEGPQRWFECEDLSASPGDFRDRTGRPVLQPTDDMRAQHLHELTKRCARHRPIAHAMPGVEHRLGQQLQRGSDALRFGPMV